MKMIATALAAGILLAATVILALIVPAVIALDGTKSKSNKREGELG